MRTLLSFVSLVCFINLLSGQNIDYSRTVINELCSPNMAGRGYVNDGDKKAATYIAKQLKLHNTLAFDKNYLQKVSFPINTFPGEMQVLIDEKNITPVEDFIASPNCKSIKGTFPIVYLPEAADTIDAVFDSLLHIDFTDKFVVAPFKHRKLTREKSLKTSGVLIPKQSLIWWASTAFEVAEVPLILVKDSLLLDSPKNITVDIKHKFYKNYKSQNIAAFIPGSEHSDSLIVFTAHYDHLGLMGDGNMFAGANDNASGTAMLLSLSKHYSKIENKPKYTTVFLFFTGEEAGLLGSQFFVHNPLFDLDRIKALINLDMVGSGSEGIALVNGKNTPWITNRIKSINDKKNYFTDILIRGESCNSDHCFFHKEGVPSVFIYTRGKEHKEYHTLKDTPENLPLTKFSELFNLLVEFSN